MCMLVIILIKLEVKLWGKFCCFVYSFFINQAVWQVKHVLNITICLHTGVKSEALPGVGCLLTAVWTLSSLSAWLLTVCSSTMIDIFLLPVLRCLPKSFKWYDSSHLDCILCQQEPCAGSTIDRRTAANCRVLAKLCRQWSHGEQLCVQRRQRCGGGSSASQAAEASGQLGRWSPGGQEQPAQGPRPTTQTRPGASWAKTEKAECGRSGAGYTGCDQDSCWQVSAFQLQLQQEVKIP